MDRQGCAQVYVGELVFLVGVPNLENALVREADHVIFEARVVVALNFAHAEAREIPGMVWLRLVLRFFTDRDFIS